MMMTQRRKKKRPRRRGAALVLAALMIVFLLGMAAFAVDVGYLFLVRTQLQVAADSGAMSGAAGLIEPDADVVATAQAFADRHVAGGRNVDLQPDDVEFGRWDFDARTFDPAAWRINAIRVTTRRDASSGGEARLFFARVFGFDRQAVKAFAVAAFVDNFDGFAMPPTGENLPILPIAMHEDTCDAMLAGTGTDQWSWDPEYKEVTSGSDGVREVSLYPQDTGAPGNFGTVKIGRTNNATPDLARQIRDGLTAEDLAPHGGSLSLDEQGVLELGGDPGISAAIKDDLAAILGEPRIALVFDQVTGQGSHAQYRIIRFVGVRVMEVELRGRRSNKRVVVQPADVVLRGGIPSPEIEPRSYHVFSPVLLVR
jgi:hypothetical protein